MTACLIWQLLLIQFPSLTENWKRKGGYLKQGIEIASTAVQNKTSRNNKNNQYSSKYSVQLTFSDRRTTRNGQVLAKNKNRNKKGWARMKQVRPDSRCMTN